MIAQETAGLYPADGSNGATMGGGSVINARVYESLRRRRFRRNSLRISQLAMTQDICEDVFEEAEYAASVASFSRVTLAGDNVWSDGWEAQTPAFTGSVSAGYVATVTAAVPA